MERLRRLIDLPGVADLEYRALLKREFAEPEARAEFPEIDECSRQNFGLTADEAEAHPRPAGWDGVETRPIPQQVAAFEAEGWDVTDDKRRPLAHLRPLQPTALAGAARRGRNPALPARRQYA